MLTIATSKPTYELGIVVDQEGLHRDAVGVSSGWEEGQQRSRVYSGAHHRDVPRLRIHYQQYRPEAAKANAFGPSPTFTEPMRLPSSML